MVVTCFSMRYCIWKQHAWVLYMCTCGSVRFFFAFRCSLGGIGSISSGMMLSVHWVGRLGARPGWKEISTCGFTFKFCAGADYGVASGVSTLGGGVGYFCCCNISFVYVVTCGGAAILKISVSCFRSAAFLLPNVVSVIVVVVLRKVWARSAHTCVVAYFE